MSWEDGKPNIANAVQLGMRWGGRPKGERFRCYICGHRFQYGEYWRFVVNDKHRNFLVCGHCDGDDVVERWNKLNDDLYEKHWWLFS